MGFLSPYLLFSLVAVALPILVHVVRLRKTRTVRFSSLQFLEQLSKGAIRSIQLKRRLLLLLRMAAIALLVVGFARPVFPDFETDPPGEGVTVLVVENSPAMSRSDRRGRLIDQAVESAETILASLPASARVILEVTHGPALSLPPMSPSLVRDQLRIIEPDNHGGYLWPHLAEVSGRAERLGGVSAFYLITEGRTTLFSRQERDEYPFESSSVLQLIRVGEDFGENAGISDVRLESYRAGEVAELSVQVQNYGPEKVHGLELLLEVAGEVNARYLADFEPFEEKLFRFEWIPEAPLEYRALVRLEGEGVLFDNHRYISLRAPDQQSLLLLSDAPSPGFSEAVQVITDVRDDLTLTTERWSDSNWGGRLSAEDRPEMVIIDSPFSVSEQQSNRMTNYVQEGGRILLLPAAEADLGSYNRFFRAVRLGRMNAPAGRYGSSAVIDRFGSVSPGSPVFDGLFDLPGNQAPRIDSPEIFYRYPVSQWRGQNAVQLAGLESGEPLLLEQSAGSGVVLLSTVGFDPGWSSFPEKPLFVPFLYELISYMAGERGGELLEHTLGEPFEIVLSTRVESLIHPETGEELIPDQQSISEGVAVSMPGKSWKPGWLLIKRDQDSLAVAVNQDTMESDLLTLEDRELSERLRNRFREVEFSSSSGLVAAGGSRSPGLSSGEAWHWLLLLALGFLLTESLTARLFKAERIDL